MESNSGNKILGNFPRREFLKKSLFAIGGATLLPYDKIFGSKRIWDEKTQSFSNISTSANEKVRLASIGIGHRGGEILNDFYNTGLVDIVALCDVDMGGEHTLENMNKFPNAARFKDFRKMFDKMADKIDAVSVGTPDFSHFPITMLALSLGIPVYVEKPMARTFNEVELMMAAAKKYNVVTQMGNQGHSGANYFQFKAWKEAGIIKDVTAISAHMNNSRRWHSFDPRITSMPPKESLPENMDWDVWLNTAQFHEYNKDYHHGQWRCWYDFGMGALGDWGAHILDTAHEFLDLGLPTEINPTFLEGHNSFFFPFSSTLEFKFPERNNMPAVDITWYDGLDNIPPLPAGYVMPERDPNIPPPSNNEPVKTKIPPGKIIYSKDLIFQGRSHSTTLTLVPNENSKDIESKLPVVPESPSNHFENFIRSVKGEEKTRSPFEIAGPLSQVFCLGVTAQRLSSKLEFDRETKQITNNKFANELLIGEPPRKGWEEFYKL
ncbi:MAG: Gfo/Idh/MocA family oxidoreductase [Ignavibacteriae bacterium]|nr:Gfo/Idh/MocA family oxidoreductase [Ignavibacteriota bacterium]MCB9208981.1 Gfo/Idh/MocA family oxidoreductase [Ignavibacteriales bacterium]MCB9218098.1 Gfo/Idh/MocA family oxidoreductase [Ignavibacteriales bacterium]MCB9260487.1 Gfo/Idh/MocA family oxidoreductase [Ignavibacteriales bacterium]